MPAADCRRFFFLSFFEGVAVSASAPSAASTDSSWTSFSGAAARGAGTAALSCLDFFAGVPSFTLSAAFALRFFSFLPALPAAAFSDTEAPSTPTSCLTSVWTPTAPLNRSFFFATSISLAHSSAFHSCAAVDCDEIWTVRRATARACLARSLRRAMSKSGEAVEAEREDERAE